MYSEAGLRREADLFNQIIRFLAERDVPSVFSHDFERDVQPDLVILLGNSSIKVAEVAAEAFNSGTGEKIVISGGIGHSTQFLYNNIQQHPLYKSILTSGKPEASIFEEILTGFLSVDSRKVLTECVSTNCGSNAEETFRLLFSKEISPSTILLFQDPILQKRSKASFKKFFPDSNILSFASFIPLLTVRQGELTYFNQDHMEFCAVDRLISLVMGEVPRLRNDELGYGPRGRNFITEVEIPEEVLSAYEQLLQTKEKYVR